jgi:predicted PurR-regulated permease PerM
VTPSPSIPLFSRRVLIAAGLIALVALGLALVIKVAQVLLLLFAAILLAVLLDGLIDMVQRGTRFPRAVALLIVCASLTLLLGGFVATAGPLVVQQAQELRDQIPRTVDELSARHDWFRSLTRRLPSPDQAANGVVGRVGGLFSSALGLLTSTLAMLVIAVYGAARPEVYGRPAATLLPPRHRTRAREITRLIGRALRHWLVARFIAMTFVGVLTSIGLMIIGLPLALPLGVLAGLLTFVPFIGSLLSIIPAAMIGLVEGPSTAIWVVVVSLAIQILEGNVVTPLIEQRAVSIPPALSLSAQLIMGVVFGVMGILLSTPLVVVLVVLVQTLYIEDVLDEDITVLGSQTAA